MLARPADVLFNIAGEQEQVARAEAARLEADYDADRIKALIANDGWDARG